VVPPPSPSLHPCAAPPRTGFSWNLNRALFIHLSLSLSRACVLSHRMHCDNVRHWMHHTVAKMCFRRGQHQGPPGRPSGERSKTIPSRPTWQTPRRSDRTLLSECPELRGGAVIRYRSIRTSVSASTTTTGTTAARLRGYRLVST
jgi:hypothetical protein